MEEHEYRETYHTLNQRRCVFEKTISSRRCTCDKAQRFHLADREGIACKSAAGSALCGELLDQMRHKARFALHLTHAEAPLPHAKEIKVQTGGLLGMQALLHPEKAGQQAVENAIGLIDLAIQRYGRLADLPYEVIVQSIVKFEGRRKRNRAGDS